MPPAHCVSILVNGKRAIIADWLPRVGWSIHSKGYLIYTSRKYQPLIKRGEFAHRITLRALGILLTSDIHVHHQDFDKLNNAPSNLCAMPRALNPNPAQRAQCPFTGQLISRQEYKRRVGSTPIGIAA